jgi:hypothetical protein
MRQLDHFFRRGTEFVKEVEEEQEVQEEQDSLLVTAVGRPIFKLERGIPHSLPEAAGRLCNG